MLATKADIPAAQPVKNTIKMEIPDVAGSF